MEIINDAVDISSLLDEDTKTGTILDAEVDDATDISSLLGEDVESEPDNKSENGKHYKKKSKKKSGKSPVFMTILLIIFALVFVFSAYKLISIRLAMKHASDDFNDISNQFHGETHTYTDEKDEPKPLTNAERFAEMRKLNPDFALWLEIDGTVLDYPVMYTPGNPEYYLHLDFYENYSFSGTPFIGAGCTPYSSSIIIYGHSMKDGSMFRTLLDYEQYDFYKAHPTFSLETPEGSEIYDIISVFRESVHYSNETNVFRYYNYVGDLDESTFNEYISKIKSISLYNIDASAVYGDKIISLSTCHYADEDARLVVVGVKR